MLYFSRKEWASAAALWRRSTEGLHKRSILSAQDAGLAIVNGGGLDATKEDGEFLLLAKTLNQLAGADGKADVAIRLEMFRTA
jgi:hypothetical protein